MFSDREKDWHFVLGYCTALAVLYVSAVLIPRLLDWLSEDAEVITVVSAPSENGAKSSTERTEVVREAIE